MPQFEISSFISQIFWLTVTFVTLYLFVEKWFHPRILKVISDRQSLVSSYIIKAQEASLEISRINNDIMVIQKDAKKNALNLKLKSSIEAKQRLDNDLIKFDEELAIKTQIENDRLLKFKNEMKANLPKIIEKVSKDIVKMIIKSPHNNSYN